jgi:hypothetical protein
MRVREKRGKRRGKENIKRRPREKIKRRGERRATHISGRRFAIIQILAL